MMTMTPPPAQLVKQLQEMTSRSEHVNDSDIKFLCDFRDCEDFYIFNIDGLNQLMQFGYFKCLNVKCFPFYHLNLNYLI